ncbi:MAG TPA: heparan-alpha-glucosaminide N-acetyltransferase domain-containing protein [Isosphaeraceae bacterium]
MAIATAAMDETIDVPPAKRHRIESIDLLRGAVMVLMVLDHCRDFFGDARVDPTNLSTTTPALFFTRWVTHLCAPTFSLLAGVSAALWGAGRSRCELARHLVTRGAWLIVLEQTWDNVFIFNIPHFLLGLVLWELGWSMIVMAGLIYLPRAVIGGLAVAMIAGHNLLDGIQPGDGAPGLLWGFLHAPGMRELPGGIPILLGYPLIPWVGVMALGYAIAPLLFRPSERRRPVLLALGLGAIAGFVALRWLNVYGDPRPWAPQGDFTWTLMSFLNVTKQPPSLLYLLVTLGVAFLGLAALDRGMGRLGAPLRVIGRVPLFFFLLQWPVAHALAALVAALRGFPVGWMFRFPPFECPEGYGNSLTIVYLSWVVTVVVLYFPSRWYWAWKQRRRSKPREVETLTDRAIS